MDDRQLRLFDEAINEDIAAAEAKLAELTKDQPSTKPRNQPKRQPLARSNHQCGHTHCGFISSCSGIQVFGSFTPVSAK